MYNWMIYIHVLAVFVFLIAHGVSSIVSLRLRKQRDPALARAWLELYADHAVYAALNGSLLVLLLSGIIGGFIGHWWGEGWIWLSLLLPIGIIVAMFVIGSKYYTRIRKALGLPWFDRGKVQPPGEPASAEEIDTLLANAPAMTMAVVGFGGIALILWLMMFKPF